MRECKNEQMVRQCLALMVCELSSEKTQARAFFNQGGAIPQSFASVSTQVGAIALAFHTCHVNVPFPVARFVKVRCPRDFAAADAVAVEEALAADEAFAVDEALAGEEAFAVEKASAAEEEVLAVEKAFVPLKFWRLKKFSCR
jgi:hypothetical protein